MKLTRIIPLLLALALLCGCSAMPFTTPEEQQAAQQAAEAAKLENQSRADPREALQTDLQFSRLLVNSAGVTLAEYQVRFPYFSKTGQKAQSFTRINEYYQNELAGLNQDADSLFTSAKEAYGPDWDTVTEADKGFFVDISYQLPQAPEGYLCVQCDFSVCENGQTEQYSQAQVFLMDNGWKLTLEALLGSDYETAAPMLLADILQWCEDNGVQVTNPEKRTLEEFSDSYALTGEGFVFYTQPFQLNNKDANRYSIPISLSAYRKMLELG
ncbi:MAG: hypothetical protein SOZ49_05200 [Clostridiaceae bacterium]|nr:hypothetical protein [Clostridia bacterium]MDY3870619.1 hypothetical protein [Clostridiaceae bacterium]